jgi:DNA replication protein DnaC
MLTEEDFARFTELGVGAMGARLREMAGGPAYDSPAFEEKAKEMTGARVNAKAERKIAAPDRAAGFKPPSACVEDVACLPEGKLGRDRVAGLASCRWVEDNEVLVIISKTGCGKSYLSQALGNAACRATRTVRYARLADVCADLNRARASGDGSYWRRLDACKAARLPIVDDFLTTPIATENAVDLFEIMEAREGRGATLIASQLEPEEWYLRIEGELMADSILSRTATTARYLDLDGPNMREYFARLRKD